MCFHYIKTKYLFVHMTNFITVVIKFLLISQQGWTRFKCIYQVQGMTSSFFMTEEKESNNAHSQNFVFYSTLKTSKYELLSTFNDKKGYKMWTFMYR